MNRLQARNLVIENTGRTDKEDLINSALDLALEEISTEALWLDLLTPGSVTLLTGQSSIALSPEVDRVSEIRLIDGLNSYRLEIRPKVWVVARYPNADVFTTNRPTVGYLEGTTLFVNCLSSEDFELRYTYCPLHPALADDADEILIRNGTPAVIAWATSWVFQAIEKNAEAGSWDARYQSLLKSAKRANTNSAITQQFTVNGQSYASPEYWLDPFAKRAP